MRLVSLLSFSFILTSCALTPPDVPVCAQVSAQKGFCAYTISEKEYLVEGADWEALKKQSLITPADSWAEIKKFILKACEKDKSCKKKPTLDKVELVDSILQTQKENLGN